MEKLLNQLGLFDLNLNLVISECEEIKRTEYPEVFQIIKNQKMSYYHTITNDFFWEETLVE